MMRNVVSRFFWILCIIAATATARADWLADRSQLDGSITGPADTATAMQATSEAVRTLRMLGRSNEVAAAELFIASEQYPGTEYLARRIVAVSESGSAVPPSLLNELFLRQNVDGGFGEHLGYESNPVDTAFALAAIIAANQPANTSTGYAIGYLQQQQTASGAYTGADRSVSTHATAVVLQAIWGVRNRFNVASQIAAARAYLLNQRDLSALWGETHISAMSLVALAPLQTADGELGASTASLRSRQLPDGSWGGDVYSTALALRALARAEAPGANPDLASVTGVVVDGDSLAALANINIRLNGATESVQTTDTNGAFRFTNLPAGSYAFSVEAQGYPVLGGTLHLAKGQLLDVGRLQLLHDMLPAAARLEGQITDTDGSGLADVTVSATGAQIVVTDASGRYVINGVPPGEVTVAASKSGYFTVAGTTTLLVGSTVNFSPVLRAVGSIGFNVTGTFKDAMTMQSLSGVHVDIGGSAQAVVVSDTSGTINLANLNPGDIHVAISLAGYETRTGYIRADGGQTLDLSASLTRIPPDAPATFVVSGQVTDDVTGAPVVGAVIQLSGAQSASAVTNDSGAYEIIGLAPGDFSILVSADGYRQAGATGDGQAHQRIDFSPRLVKINEQATAIRAVVVDDTTGLPIEEAIVSATSENGSSTALTQPDGQFTLWNLDGVPTTITIVATGYRERALSLVPVTGVLNDLGTLPLQPETQAVPITVQVHGVTVDSVTDAAISGVHVTVTTTAGSQIVTSASDGQFALTVLAGEIADLRFSAAGHVDLSLDLLVSTETGGLGQIRLRPEGLDVLLPDLVVVSVDTSQLESTVDTFQVSGVLTAQIQNRGYAPVPATTSVVAFEDGNGNGVVDTEEVEYGRTPVGAELLPGASFSFSMPISGASSFRDAPIALLVDADQALMERDESNNAGLSVGSCVALPPAASALAPVLKWQWSGSPQRPSDKSVFGPVMVGQLTDDNSDGAIDHLDVPDLVFSTAGGALTVVSGNDGYTVWQTAGTTVTGYGSPALADIDGDGLLEIVMSNPSRTRLLAFEHDGAVKWNVAHGPTHSGITRDGITIADLDGDGVPEIVSGRRVYSNAGALLWQGTRDHGGTVSYGTIPLAADVNQDGTMEVIAGRTAYTTSGSLLWHQSSAVSDGFNAIGNFDNDEFPEIVLVATGRVYLFEHTGAIKWGPVALSGSNSKGGAPTVGDFDGDGEPEIGIAGATYYTVLETDGSLKWRRSITDVSSSVTGSSLFDFDGDGRIEVVYADELNLYIYDGATGAELFRTPNESGTTLEYPVVADVDGDSRAELVVAGNAGTTLGIRVFEGGEGEWMPTRAIWNQSAYHIGNVNDDGSVPAAEEASWLTHNSYRANLALQRAAEPVADLTAGRLRLIDNGAGQPASLTVRIGNAGTPVAAGLANVAFYDGPPDSGGTLLGTAAVPALASGAYLDVRLDGVTTVSSGGVLYAVADSTHRITECNESNNTATTPGRPALGTLLVSTDAAVYAPGVTIAVQGVIANTGRFTNDYRVSWVVQNVAGNHVAFLPTQTVPSLNSGDNSSVTESFSSAGLLSGRYRVYAELIGGVDQLLTTATTEFTIEHDIAQGPAAGLRLTTDRQSYNTTDRVTVESLSMNLTQSTLMQGGSLLISVRNPAGQIIFDETTAIGDLVPGGSRVGSSSLVLTDAAQGAYQVTGSLLDGNNGVLATAETAFQVQEDVSVTLVGEVGVAATTVTTLEGQVCTSTVRNTGTQDIAVQPVRYLVVPLSQQQEQPISQVEAAVDLSAGASVSDIRSVSTTGYIPGDYACILQAQFEGQWRTLAYAAFAVTAPPIRIDSSLNVGQHGRVLLLVDSSAPDTSDPFGPGNAPDLNTQRAHIESVLQTHGWSYTIVDNATSFEHEFNSGGYEIVVVFAEVVKIPEALQDRMVAEVAKGVGLIVAGNHDNRNSRLYAALGIKSTGKNLDASALEVLDSEVMAAAEEGFPVIAPPNAINLDGATQIAQYLLMNPRPDQASESAVAVHRFGLGKGVYAGFDLPLEGAAAGDDSLFGELFARSLEFVHPAILTPYGGRVIPLKLTLANVGVATPGRVIVSLPAGAQAMDVNGGVVLSDGTGIVWSFSLAQGEELQLPFWIRLPDVIGDVTIGARIQVGTEGDYQDHSDGSLVIRVEARP